MSLEIKNLHKSFTDEQTGAATAVLESIDLTVDTGGFVSIIGPSGCGKTTLLRIIAGLEHATSGEIFIHGQTPAEPWQQVGFVFQEYALFPWRRVWENIAFGLEMKGIPPAERRDRAFDLIKRFGLEGSHDRYPRELSGGMKQRVALARTMINDPDIILMDEPFGALDSQTRSQMRSFLLDVWQQSHKTILFITHSIDEAIFLSQNVIGFS
ncbi:MAG: ABC transporter ATP-binding protein, partial [Deltaproteobacteria bacterium]|nr:ABC transporter ATP-binding protein [Deltaproteobacteria bacterium]